MTVVVFCGPTVDAATVRSLLPTADCRPPAGQGDLFAAARDRPAAIALVDGVFCERPAVWHREILAALEAGIPVWGAASMGALRAVECAAFGMIGKGRIVDAYRAGRYSPFADPFDDDDEVAVLHGPPELGSPALSDALVDLRETLARAESAGAIDATVRDAVARRLKATFFAERRFDDLLATVEELAGAAAAAAVATQRCSQKREDALAVLTELARDGGGPVEVTWLRERTGDWERFVATSEVPPLAPAERAALERLARDPSRRRRLERRAAMRLAALEVAAAEPGDVREALGDFRIERGLVSRARLEAWLEANDLADDGLAALLREEARLGALVERFPAERLDYAILAELRSAGEYIEESGR